MKAAALAQPDQRMPAAAASPAGKTFASVESSPMMVAQRLRVQDFANGDRGIVQRVKPKPDKARLQARLSQYITAKALTCYETTGKVMPWLRDEVDAPKNENLKVAMLTWKSPTTGGGDHVASLARWDGTWYVVDTTIGQFAGAPEFFFDTREAWQARVESLARAKDPQVHSFKMSESNKVAPSAATGLKEKDEGEWDEDVPAGAAAGSAAAAAPKTTASSAAPQKGSGGGCYLTSACVQHRGLPDDCRELDVLRAFRDGWLRGQPEGPALIDEYYRTAPALVFAIVSSPDADSILEEIYAVVRVCVKHIEMRRPRAALRAYADMVHMLPSLVAAAAKGGAS